MVTRLNRRTAAFLAGVAGSLIVPLAAATGQDRHSKLVDYDIFVNAPKPDFTDVTRVVPVNSVDLRLKRGSAAVDAGVALPNVADGYVGRAPDLGAYELGAPLPHYGPR